MDTLRWHSIDTAVGCVKRVQRSMKILCLAPHCDDETFGCGGILARYTREGHEVTVAVVTGPGEGEHPVFPRSAWDIVRAECREAIDILGVKHLWFENLPAAVLADLPKHEVNRVVHALIERAQPEILFVPHPFDLHKDHREVFDAASVAWRPTHDLGCNIREIYAYETLSETGWNAGGIEPAFVPNVWVDISGSLDQKLEAIEKYESQIRPFPNPRSIEAARHLAAYRGAQMRMTAAEAFVLVRKRG
jgi:LmbE family N-acetylglucosaminyl deacetylase